MNRIKGNGDRAAVRKPWLNAEQARQSSAAQASPRVLLSLLLLLFTALFAEAAAPQWWSDRGVIDPQAAANDYAAINQGQLKNLAIKAHAELRQRLPASVWTTTQGMALDDFIATLQTTTNSQFNYSAVNIGQLKNVARPFYDVLMLPSVRFATAYPWANATTPANDFAMANIGQAKNLFAFEFSTFDADGNGISDIWEMQYFGRTGISTTADPDRDNVSNLQEFQNGSSPIDYYNGVIPTVVITGGDGQRSSAGVVLTTPLKVKVTKADTSVWANAPVSFTVLSGGGSVALTTSSVPVSATSYTLLTDANGEAQIYFRQPTQAGVTSYIQATVGGAAPVVFTEYSSREAGYWKLDETSGTIAADASIAGNQATLYGTPAWLPNGGRINGALQLSGPNDYACLASATPLNITGDLSIAAWIQIDASSNDADRYMRIVSKKSEWNSGGGYEIEYNPHIKRLCFAGQGQEQLLAYNTDLNSGWHYIVATLQKKSNSSNYEPRIYVDGVEKIKSTTISATQSGVYITNHSPAYTFKADQSFSPLEPSTASLAIGRNGQIPGQSTANGTDYYTGRVDDVRVFNYALTVEEISKLSSDADEDGIADNWELQWFGNLSTANASSDFDGDDISDLHEYLAETDPKVASPDTDHDGVPDNYELYGPNVQHYLKVSITKNSTISDTFQFVNGTFEMTSDKTDVKSGLISIDNGRGTENYVTWSGQKMAVDTSAESVVRGGFAVSDPGCTSGSYPYQPPGGYDYNGSEEYHVAQNSIAGGVSITATLILTSHPPGGRTPPYTYEFRFQWTTPHQGVYSDSDVPDSDHDGLTDGEELYLSRTDVRDPDTDHDGMPDGWEYRYGLNPKDPADVNLDPDQDGLTNLVEYQFDSDPLLADGERNAQGVPVGDGMPDKYEAYQGLAPRRNDSGYMSLYRNGLTRLEQMLSAVTDTDLDGLSNVAEAKLGTNPTSADSDGDGMPDVWEVMNGFDPNNLNGNDASLDKDSDGYANHYLNGGNPSTFEHTNVQEFHAGTLPYHYDSDNDGLGDRWELMYGTNPLSFCENLIAWYRLEESGEYLWDYSGNNLDGHAYGVTSATGVTGGSDSKAYQFGVISASQPLKNDSYLLVRHDARLIPDEGITIAFWFRPTQDIPAWESDLVTKSGSYTLTYRTDGKLTYTLITGVTGGSTGSTTITSTASLSAAQWNHVALTYDKPTGRQTLYINGTTSSSTLGTANSPIAIPSDTLAAPLIIGSVRKIPCRTPQCNIDDIRIYKGALPPGASTTTPVTITDTATIYRLAHPDDPTLEPNRDDWDHEGLSNIDEYRRGTDPQNIDTDGDGFTDGEEVHGITVNATVTNSSGVHQIDKYFSNPRLVDSDGDGISDYNEIHGLNAAGQPTGYGPTNPSSADTDGDGYYDDEELNGIPGSIDTRSGQPAGTLCKTNPNNFDSDNDGMPDGWELKYNLNFNSPHKLNPCDSTDAAKGAVSNASDPNYYDGDSFTNLQEYQNNTSPLAYDRAPGTIANDLGTDTDHDGLSDYMEIAVYKTNPNKADTIGDGLGDYYRAVNDLLEYDNNGNLLGEDNPSALQPQNQAAGNPDNDSQNNTQEQASNTNPTDSDNITASALGETPISVRSHRTVTISSWEERPTPQPIEYGSNTVTIKVPDGSSVYLAESKTGHNLHVLDFMTVNSQKLVAMGTPKAGKNPSDFVGSSPSTVYNYAGSVSITSIAEAAPKSGDDLRSITISRSYLEDLEVIVKPDEIPDPEPEPTDPDPTGGSGGGGPWEGIGLDPGGGADHRVPTNGESEENPETPDPEKDDKKEKNTYSSSAIWVIVVPGIQKPELKTTSIEAPSTDLTEEKENNPGAYTLKRQKADDPAPTTKIRLTAMKTERTGATRKLKWDPQQLVIVGQENNSEGTLEISEDAGDKTYQAYGHEKMTGSATVSLTATTSGGIFMGEDTVLVNLASIEITFEKVGDNWNIEDNKDADGNWMTGKGKRMFVDAKTPTESAMRDTVYVKVKTSAPQGWKVKLKAFDVDDPTPDSIDPQHVIDSNDSATVKQGNDNRGYDNLGMSQPPHFVSSTDVTVTCTIDSQGIAKLDNGELPKLQMTDHPGDNVRVAAIFLKQDGSPMYGQSFDGLQVDNSNQTGYVPSSDDYPKNGDFSGALSPMITVWRKLNIEIDSMTTVPTNGDQKNYEEGTVLGVTYNLGSNQSSVTLSSLLTGPENRYENGYLTIDGVSYEVESNTNDWTNIYYGDRVVVKGNVPNSTINHSFTIVDDDDKNLAIVGLPSALPRNQDHSIIINGIRSKYAPAYIQVEDANALGWNPNQIIPFKLNLEKFSLDAGAAKDLTDRDVFWTYTITFAYQCQESGDGDPNTKISGYLGLGLKYPYPSYASFGYAAIFMENIREQAVGEIYKVTPTILAEHKALYNSWLLGVIAHEIGHGPGSRSPADDHSELELMQEGSSAINADVFSPSTINRFRSAKNWTH